LSPVVKREVHESHRQGSAGSLDLENQEEGGVTVKRMKPMNEATFVAGVLLASLAGVAAAQQSERPPGDAPPPATPEMPPWAVPGEHHKAINYKVGKWAVVVRFLEPGKPALEATATSTQKWLMDGRFLQDTTDGNWLGLPFSGRGITAYDVARGKYVYTWIDNMSTAITVADGTHDPASGSLVWTGEAPHFVTGKLVRMRWVEKVIDSDHWRLDTYMTGADGQEMKSSEFMYTRVK
jgi:hypothetical protein